MYKHPPKNDKATNIPTNAIITLDIRSTSEKMCHFYVIYAPFMRIYLVFMTIFWRFGYKKFKNFYEFLKNRCDFGYVK